MPRQVQAWPRITIFFVTDPAAECFNTRPTYPANGCYVNGGDKGFLIYIRDDMSLPKTLCVISHELKHVERGNFHEGPDDSC